MLFQQNNALLVKKAGSPIAIKGIDIGAVREPRVEGVPPSNRGQDARDTQGAVREPPLQADTHSLSIRKYLKTEVAF
jgi:hypothetical protein